MITLLHIKILWSTIKFLNSGKSQLTKCILQRKDEIICPPVNQIIYCYGEYQDELFKELKDTVSGIVFHPGLPTEFGDGLRTPSLYILDDLMEEVVKSKEVHNLFVRASHHQNISVILLIQNFFHKDMRKLTLNAKYVCIFKNPRDTGFICTLGAQMNKRKRNHMMEDAFEQCIVRPHGYLFIDCAQQQDDNYRLRNNIFPDSDCIVFTKK